MAKKKYNNKDKARKFRSMRPTAGENYMYDFSQPSNSHSTHLATTYEADGKFYVVPSITNNRAPYATNVYHPQSFRQAIDAGEGIPFDTQEEASKFAEGSWKLPKYPRPNYKHGGPHDPPNPFAQQNQEYITQLQTQAAAGNEMAIHQLQLAEQDSRIPEADFSAGMAEYMPVTGEISDAMYTADALSEGNYGDAALYAAGFALPFVPGKAIKKFVKGMIPEKVKDYAKNIKLKRQNAETLSEINRFSPNQNVNLKNISYTTAPDVELDRIIKDQFPVDSRLFMNELRRGATPFADRIASRVNELSTPRGMKRLEELYAPSLPPTLNSFHAAQKASKRVNELANSPTYNKLAEDFFKTNRITNPSIAESAFANKSLFGNAAYFPGKSVANFRPDIDAKDMKLIKDDMMGLGAGYVDNVPVMDHEINHFLQQGDRTVLDAELSQLTPRGDLGIDDAAGSAYDYFKTGSKGKEPTSFAAELRSTLLDKGHMKYADDGYFQDVTSDQLKKAYKELSANPAYKQIKKQHPIIGSSKPNTYFSPQRIFDFMEPTDANFKLLSKSLNKLPVAIPGILGARYAADNMKNEPTNGSLKYGGQVRSYENGGPTDSPVSEKQGTYNMLADRAADMMLQYFPDYKNKKYGPEDIGYHTLQPNMMGPTFSSRHPELAKNFSEYTTRDGLVPYFKGKNTLQAIPAKPIPIESNMELIDTRPKTLPAVKQPITSAPIVPTGNTIPTRQSYPKPPQSYPPTPYRGSTPNPPPGAQQVPNFKPSSAPGIFDTIIDYFKPDDDIKQPVNFYIADEYYTKDYPELGKARDQVQSFKDTMDSSELETFNTFREGPETDKLREKYPGLYEARENLGNVRDSLTLYNPDFGRIQTDVVDRRNGKDMEPQDKRAEHLLIRDIDKKNITDFFGYSKETIKNFTNDDYKDLFSRLYSSGNQDLINKIGIDRKGNTQNPSSDISYRDRGLKDKGKYYEQLKDYYNNYSVPEDPGMLESVQDFFGFKNGGKMKQYKKGGRPGLWANIHAKRKRIKAGSKEKMRKPGSKGAPTAAALKRSQATYGGMLPEYGLGGFLKGALSGVVGKVPVVGGMLKEAINVDPNDKSSKIGGMLGGAGAMLFNPMGAAGAALDAVEGDEENSEIEEVAQDGGQFMPKVDYEAEDGEVIVGDVKVNRAYNGGTMKSYKGGGMHLLSGPKHSEGGIGIMQFGGDSSYVFSNSMDLKVPKEFGKFNTFADAAKSRSKSLEEIAEMRMGGESYDKRTADLMEPLAMVEFENLFNAQEDFKEQNNIGNPTRTAQFGEEFEPNPALMGDAPGLGGSLFPAGYGESQGLNATYGSGIDLPGVSSPKSKEGKSKLPWELYAANALPGLFNIGKGLFGTSPTMELEREKEQEYRDFNPLIDSYLDNQRRNLLFSKKGLEGSGASGSQIRMGYQNMYSGSQANTGQFFKDLNNQIESSRLATDTGNQGVMSRNQQRTLMEDQFAADNYAGNSFSKGLGQLINTGTNLYMDNLKSQNIGTQMYDMFGNFIGGKNKGK